MKRIILSTLLGAALPLQAMAGDCTGGTGIAINDGDLDDQVVCGVSEQNPDTWQEHHAQRSGGSGTLTEFARGPGHPRDPSKVVGSWSQSGNTVTYDYGGSSFSFDVFDVGGTLFFCTTGPAPSTHVASAPTLIASATPTGCP